MYVGVISDTHGVFSKEFADFLAPVDVIWHAGDWGGSLGFVQQIRDLGKPVPQSGNLQRWAQQGVLLLNATLTVEAHRPGSHQNKGWEELTDAAIMALNQRREHLVYMLWGSYAQRKGQFIDRHRNLVLAAVHPSPLSAFRGFIGCGHFSKANNYLVQNGFEPINW